MRRLFLGLAAVAVLALAACSTTPRSAVATVEVALTAADRIATDYIKLPACPQPTHLCSDTAVVKRIGALEQDAYDAVQIARTASASNGPAAVVAAQAAVAALQKFVVERASP